MLTAFLLSLPLFSWSYGLYREGYDTGESVHYFMAIGMLLHIFALSFLLFRRLRFARLQNRAEQVS